MSSYRTLRRVWIVLGVTALAKGCGGSDAPTAPPPPEPARPTTVTVSPSMAELTVLGATIQLAAEVRDQNARVMAGVTVTWRSSDPSVATTDNTGLVTGVGEGDATVTARAGSASGSAVVTVMQPVATVEVTPQTDTIGLGTTLDLTAEGFDENGDAVVGAEFSWESSDVAIATIDASGLVTAVAVGTATITASAGSGQGTAEITVMDLERAALLAFYEATDGPNWVNNENWLTDAPLEDWHGVTIDPSGRVTRIYLRNNGLTGPIPSEMDDLTSLEWLTLDHNELTGPIPSDLSSLPNLRWLDLGYNKLTGPIPSELSNLPRLENLFLRNNQLSGPIPPELASLSILRRLYLDHNVLTGPIPSEIGNLASLEALYLGHNTLTGAIPHEIGKLSNLQRMSLSNNNLTGAIPPELMNLTALQFLVLGGNPGICVPDDPDFQAWLIDKGTGLFPCPRDDIRFLPRALMRLDGNGMSLILPDDLRIPAEVSVSDPNVVTVNVVDGKLDLIPRRVGQADVELVPSGNGLPAVVSVSIRAPVGTFGIDIVVERPAPLGYAEGMVVAADWWSSVLDGTEWPDRPLECPNDLATALMDELLIHARVDPNTEVAGYAHTCLLRYEAGDLPAYRPSGGGVQVHPNFVSQGVLRHEIGHVLGLVLWPEWTGLTSEDRRYFTGSRTVAAYRAGGGDPRLPGVPIEAEGRGSHWHDHGDLMSPTSDSANNLSLAALADAGYTVDMSKAIPWQKPIGVAAVANEQGFRDRVFVEIVNP